MLKDVSKTEARKLSQVLFLIFIYKDYFHCKFIIFIPHSYTYQFCPPTPSYDNFPLMFESFTNRLTEHGKNKNSNSGEWPVCRSGVLRRLSSRKALEKQKYQTTFYICKYIHIYLNRCTSVLSKLNLTPWCAFHISTIMQLETVS